MVGMEQHKVEQYIREQEHKCDGMLPYEFIYDAIQWARDQMMPVWRTCHPLTLLEKNDTIIASDADKSTHQLRADEFNEDIFKAWRLRIPGIDYPLERESERQIRREIQERQRNHKEGEGDG